VLFTLLRIYSADSPPLIKKVRNVKNSNKTKNMSLYKRNGLQISLRERKIQIPHFRRQYFSHTRKKCFYNDILSLRWQMRILSAKCMYLFRTIIRKNGHTFPESHYLLSLCSGSCVYC
jgi:hypothetical protein